MRTKPKMMARIAGKKKMKPTQPQTSDATAMPLVVLRGRGHAVGRGLAVAVARIRRRHGAAGSRARGRRTGGRRAVRGCTSRWRAGSRLCRRHGRTSGSRVDRPRGHRSTTRVGTTCRRMPTTIRLPVRCRSCHGRSVACRVQSAAYGAAPRRDVVHAAVACRRLSTRASAGFTRGTGSAGSPTRSSSRGGPDSRRSRPRGQWPGRRRCRHRRERGVVRVDDLLESGHVRGQPVVVRLVEGAVR